MMPPTSIGFSGVAEEECLNGKEVWWFLERLTEFYQSKPEAVTLWFVSINIQTAQRAVEAAKAARSA